MSNEDTSRTKRRPRAMATLSFCSEGGTGRRPDAIARGEATPCQRSRTFVMKLPEARVGFRGKMRSGQQEQAREERPEHQADRQRERSVDFREIQPGQREDVTIFQRFGK